MSYISEIRKKVGHDPIFTPTAACFVLKDNELLLQLRTDNCKWGANGGCLEFNETPVEAMKRELQEELGIIATSYKLIGVYAGPEQHMLYPNGDEVYIITTIFLVDNYDGEIQPDSSELKEAKWFPIDEDPVKDEINPVDYQPLLDTIEYVREYRTMMKAEIGSKLGQNFKELIIERCKFCGFDKFLVENHDFELSKIDEGLFGWENGQHITIPGMLGGFDYFLEKVGNGFVLYVEQSSRMDYDSNSFSVFELSISGAKLLEGEARRAAWKKFRRLDKKRLKERKQKVVERRKNEPSQRK